MKRASGIAAVIALTLASACATTDADQTADAAASPPALDAAAAPAPTEAAQAQPSVAETARSAGQFNTLLKAAEAAGALPLLEGGEEITVFAPTDEAFAALPAGMLDRLLLPENKGQLAAVIGYHVVPGRVTSQELAGKTTDAPTKLGMPLKIDATGQTVKVGDATLVRADIQAGNGVIHVVDKVIIPQS